MTARLIVNADDFGYTAGINEAIVELHGARALSSATLMATGVALDDALARLGRSEVGRQRVRSQGTAPGALGTGCHVVLLDGTPVLPPGEIKSLLGAEMAPRSGGPAAPATAGFRVTLGGFVADLVRGRIRDAEIEREAVAQIRLLQARGVHITHLDTHKHTHMFPRVLRPLLRAALQCGVKAIRNPFEPAWSTSATMQARPRAPFPRFAEVRLLSLLRPAFARLVAEAGLRTTSGAIGVLATGTLQAASLECLLAAALKAAVGEEARGRGLSHEEPVFELVCHPGYHDAALAAQRTRLLGAREAERSALLQAASTLGRFKLIHYGELAG